MFDIGASEVLLVAVVAIVVIGPKDMPAALRQAGRWIGKARRMSTHFRTGLDAMIREAEMEDMEKKWKEQNEKVMRLHPNGGPADAAQTGAYPSPPPAMTPTTPAPPVASAESVTPPPPTATPAPAPTPNKAGE
ncbi:Sec-independent protein translocase protein TatB [Altererythrobacter sp. KTW20L]|uniref:Sec-independent protein translocase protein TatB n=1 Tax=Altererythrobacter sp. KTW20L TaxID=2942210 RepID=UPI0020BF54D8|nr:Sec-independent protein translocase protein TatB [Altererythrobacter sp. KTW20L]